MGRLLSTITASKVNDNGNGKVNPMLNNEFIMQVRVKCSSCNHGEIRREFGRKLPLQIIITQSKFIIIICMVMESFGEKGCRHEN